MCQSMQRGYQNGAADAAFAAERHLQTLSVEAQEPLGYARHAPLSIWKFELSASLPPDDHFMWFCKMHSPSAYILG